MQEWWTRPFRAYQSNLREVDATLDVHSTVEFIQSLGCNTWLLNTAGIAAFYPSNLEHQYHSPWLKQRESGDLIGDAVSVAHQKGIKLVCRLDMSKMQVDLADQHPDWLYRDSRGNSPIFNGLRNMCPSGPYYQVEVHKLIDEILDNYPVDGIFFNWFQFPEYDYAFREYDICHCVNCKRGYQRFAGSSLPAVRDFTDPNYRKYRTYVEATMAGISTAVRQTVSKRDWPVALVAKQESDVAWSESGGNAVFGHGPVWIYQSGDDVLEFQTSDDREIWHHKGIFIDMSWRFEIDQQGLLGPTSVQAIAHGGNLCIYQNGTPETIPPASFEGMGNVTRFHAKNEQYYDGLEPAGRVAVVHATATQKFLGDNRFSSAEGLLQVRNEARGITSALRRGHVPFVLLPQHNLGRLGSEALLAKYDLIVLPNASILDDDEVSILDEFVSQGGNLLATGETGLRDAAGEATDTFRLACLGTSRVLGQRHLEEELRGSYLRVTPGAPPLGRLVPHDYLVVYHKFLETELRHGAVGDLHFIPPAAYGPPEKIYWDSSHETDIPGLIWYRQGKGRSGYFPWPIGRMFYDWSLPGHGEAILSAVGSLSETQINTNAPEHVELVLAEQSAKGRRVIHLINNSGRVGARAFANALPIHNITLSVPSNAKRVQALKSGQSLGIQRDNEGRSSVTLPTLKMFEVISVDFQ